MPTPLMLGRTTCLATAALLITICSASYGQGMLGLAVKPDPSKTLVSASGSDPWKRATPRSSVYSFLEACHSKDFARAERYLDLSKLSKNEQQEDGAELAKQLAALLDHDPHFDIGEMSDDPAGNPDDDLGPGRDKLVTLEADGHPVTLTLENEQRGDMKVWLVSSETVARIPDLAATLGESRLEKIMPAPLVKIRLVGTSLWVWLALLLTASLVSFLSRVLSRAVLALLRPIVRRFASEADVLRLVSFTEPLRLLLTIAVVRAAEEVFTPSALLRHYLNNLLTLLFFLGAAALAMRIVDVVADRVRMRLDAKQRALSYSVLPLFERIAKICIFCIAVLSTLEAWDYPITTILAGVGVGGLAVALAAQKTIENLFGGVSLITDRPVLVGDFCQFGGQVGTVEDIGLRSTRIRTLDRTVVTIPNAQFSTMTLENYSRRDRMWFHPTLKLRRDTSPEHISAAMAAIVRVLQDHPSVDPTDVPVRFTKIGDQSFDLDIFSYVKTADFNEYLKVQSELLLKLVEAVNASGASFSLPLQESIVTPLNEEILHRLGMAHAAVKAQQDDVRS